LAYSEAQDAAGPEPTELERALRIAVADWDLLSADELSSLFLQAADALAAHHIRMVLLGPLVEQRDAARSTMQRVAREMLTRLRGPAGDERNDATAAEARAWTRMLGGGS
jgi:hypothetical protein